MNYNLKRGLIISAIYILGMSGIVAILIGLSAAMGVEDIKSFFTIPYIILYNLGLVAAFSSGYFFSHLLDAASSDILYSIRVTDRIKDKPWEQNVKLYPDISKDYLTALGKIKVWKEYSSAIAVASVLSTISVFIFLEEPYIGLLCILLALFLASTVCYLQLRSQYKSLWYARFSFPGDLDKV